MIFLVKHVLEYTATCWVDCSLNPRKDLDQSVGCELDSLFHVSVVYVDIYRTIQVESIAIIHRVAALFKDSLVLGEGRFMRASILIGHFLDSAIHPHLLE